MLYCECLQLPHQITSLISQEPTEAAKIVTHRHVTSITMLRAKDNLIFQT